MNLSEKRRQLTAKRRLQQLNDDFIDEYEEAVDDYVLEDKRFNIREKVEQYILAAAPWIIAGLFTHSTIVAEESNILTQQRINNLIETTILDYKEHITGILVSAEETLSQLSIDKTIYEDFRKEGMPVTESLQFSTPKGNEPVASASPVLFKGSIENKMLQMEATDEYYGMTSLTDKDGNPLVVSKEWVWSELEDTRHSEMDGVVIPVDEPFQVLNEVTGEVSVGMYPRDPSMEAGNIVNCGCGLIYLDEFGEEVTL